MGLGLGIKTIERNLDTKSLMAPFNLRQDRAKSTANVKEPTLSMKREISNLLGEIVK